MNKQEFLATSLPYGIYVKTVTGNVFPIISVSFGNMTLARVKPNNDVDFPLPINHLKPIIRHMDSLTKECVQADYNDGKPFTPIQEIMRIKNNGDWILLIDKINFDVLPTYITNLLIKWHFWVDMSENEEVVYVNESFNPYKNK